MRKPASGWSWAAALSGAVPVLASAWTWTPAPCCSTKQTGLKDWGFSAGLVFDPQPESERGLSVTLGQDWGGDATGGIDALFAANPLEQRSGVEGTSRWTLEAAYGLPAFAGRFTGAPYVGLALAAGARGYTVGWRLTPEVTEQDITFEVKATRSESSDARPDHGVELDIRRIW